MIVPRVISLSGFKGIGKNTFADDLTKRYGYKEAAFADPLKDKVADWIAGSCNIPKDVPEYIASLVDECREEYRTCWMSKVEEYYPLRDDRATPSQFVRSKPYSDNLRKLIQFVGTEYYRNKDEAYWIKSMHLDPDQHYVITDRRFHNETEFSLLFGAACWNIYREGFGGGDLHPSEVNINSLFNHCSIHNVFGEQDKIPQLNDSYLAFSAKLNGVVTMEIE